MAIDSGKTPFHTPTFPNAIQSSMYGGGFQSSVTAFRGQRKDIDTTAGQATNARKQISHGALGVLMLDSSHRRRWRGNH